MIATVCLNPSIDHMLRVESLAYGGLNRVLGSRCDAGGKGLNVAVAISTLGIDAECVGFMYKESARLFETHLLKNGTAYDFIWCEGAARTNFKVFDEGAGVVTELNEPGRPASPADLERMEALIAHRAEHADILILSGSMPPNCPKDFYARAIEAVEGLNCRCILDADGEALRLGIEARPHLIKPNRFELENLVGRALPTLEDVRGAAREVVARGVKLVAVSLGSDGAMIVSEGESYAAARMDVAVRSTVGAGDAMVAGLAAGLLMDAPLARTFAMGVASASAMCMTEGSAAFLRADYKELLDKVHIEKL